MSRLLPGAVSVGLSLLAAADPTRAAGGEVLIELGSPTRYLANLADPGIELDWVAPDFDDGNWNDGRLGVGYEDGPWGGVSALVRSELAVGTASAYTRTSFTIDDPTLVQSLYLGVDFDDGYVAWINGTEVARSSGMPAGPPRWDARPESHESSNGANPYYPRLLELGARAIPLLRAGRNVLAIGVWNHGRTSDDLVVVPKLVVNQPLGTFVTRGPYLNLGTESGVTVRWRTDKPTDSRVAFGSRPAALERTATLKASTTEHEVVLTGLEPDTAYCYSVGTSTTALAGADDEHCFRTAPRRGARQPIRVWVVGDSGSGGPHVAAVRQGFEEYNRGRPVSLWLMLGDDAYPYGKDDQFQRAVFNTFPRELSRTVVWSTVGNHDDAAAKEEARGTIYDVFTFPTAGEAGGVPSGTEAYYSFDHANAHFVCLNSQHVDTSPGGPMLRWLARDLDATEAEWIVAFWHHAPYSTGLHDSDDTPKMAAMRKHVLPLLDAKGVDLVLTGHTHAYERSHLLRGHYGSSDTLTPEMILDPGDGREGGSGPYRKPQGRAGASAGIVYAVVGCSGEAVEDVLEHPVMTVNLKRTGSLLLEIAGDRLHAEFVGADASVLDEFTIVKEKEEATAPARTGTRRTTSPHPGSQTR